MSKRRLTARTEIDLGFGGDRTAIESVRIEMLAFRSVDGDTPNRALRLR